MIQAYVVQSSDEVLARIRRARFPRGGGSLAVVDADHLYPSVGQADLKLKLIAVVRRYVSNWAHGCMIIELLIFVIDHQIIGHEEITNHCIRGRKLTTNQYALELN